MTLPAVDTLVFDVFGTVVDWRSGVIRDGERLNEAKGLDVNWAAFAGAWREEYQPQLPAFDRERFPGTISIPEGGNRLTDSLSALR